MCDVQSDPETGRKDDANDGGQETEPRKPLPVVTRNKVEQSRLNPTLRTPAIGGDDQLGRGLEIWRRAGFCFRVEVNNASLPPGAEEKPLANPGNRPWSLKSGLHRQPS